MAFRGCLFGLGSSQHSLAWTGRITVSPYQIFDHHLKNWTGSIQVTKSNCPIPTGTTTDASDPTAPSESSSMRVGFVSRRLAASSKGRPFIVRNVSSKAFREYQIGCFPTVVLDGANIAWEFGEANASHVDGTKRPLSLGLLKAIHYEPWKDSGLGVVAFLPRSYVEGPLKSLVDGGSKLTAVWENLERVEDDQLGERWICWPLYQEYLKGNIILVDRESMVMGNAADDIEMISFARAQGPRGGAYVCSNDQFREHSRKPVHGFTTRKSFRVWCSKMRIGYSFEESEGELSFLPESIPDGAR